MATRPVLHGREDGRVINNDLGDSRWGWCLLSDRGGLSGVGVVMMVDSAISVVVVVQMMSVMLDRSGAVGIAHIPQWCSFISMMAWSC